MKKYIMALDQGTTSSRCIIFDKCGNIVSLVQREFPQIFPKEGWVEHDPMVIWSTQMAAVTEAFLKTGAAWDEVTGIGITNQRETIVLWDRETGAPVYNAIVWQCRRTADHCRSLEDMGYSRLIKEKTGLLLDPYFSASKISWILDNVEGVRERALRGEICFGTIDTWLIYNLTDGKVHATDYSNASRTMLFNINTLKWDDELLDIFNIPKSILPEVFPSSHIYGHTDPQIFGASLPIGGVAGDQQAALFGQCRFAEGELKNTYGTGGFLLMNTGDKPKFTDTGLITTIAWGLDGKVTYALEGSVFVCGAAIQWLRDGMKLIDSAADSEYYASKVKDAGGVIVVPAFAGLGAPWWDPYARGMIIGITRATTKYHIIRATLDSLAYQTADVIELMESATEFKISELSVDGGASGNDLLLSFQADLLGVGVLRPECIESTALGAAYLAGLATGFFSSLESIKANHTVSQTFLPHMDTEKRNELMATWRKAVERSLGWNK